MDNALTPNKIQRLINIAEDKSFNLPRQALAKDYDLKRFEAQQAHMSKSTVNYESSSGILDLDRLEGFGESALGNESTSFNPGELTGRSTGADDMDSKSLPLGRHSLAIDSITSQMNKQTNEIQDLMRHSIAAEYSFHSKRDLTADEASLAQREAAIPLQQTQTYFADSVQSISDQSVGSYFLKRCPEFMKVLAKTDSPDRSFYSAHHSITEVSLITPLEPTPSNAPHKVTLDESLDCVPVRQPRLDKVPEKNLNNPTAKNYDKQIFMPNTETNDSYHPLNDYSTNKNQIPKHINPLASSSFVSQKYLAPTKPTDVLIRNLQASMRLVTDETEGSTENSLSISKIADYLGKQSNISVTDMLQLNQKNPKKQTLTEVQMHLREKQNDLQVTNLRETRTLDTASSSGTINTVIPMHQLKISQDTPEIVLDLCKDEADKTQHKRSTKSKSPSSKSQSTLSTVHENFPSFKSGDSPLQTSRGDANNTHTRIPSPNKAYTELDKSVDWCDVLQHQWPKQIKNSREYKQERLVEEQWADVTVSPTSGFVGSSCTASIQMTNLTDNWLTAKLQFDNLPNDGKDLTIELPRQPLLLSPLKCEKFTLHITSYVETNTTLSYTLHLKDTSLDSSIEQRGELDVSIKMPVIQAMSCNGVNNLTFPPTQEKSSFTKSFVLVSDCAENLQLALSIVEGDSIFTIKSVQQISKSDINKALTDRQNSTDDQGKAKSKGTKQLCILSSGNAIKVTIRFNAPKLSELQIEESIVTFNGALNVNLFGVDTVLRRVDLVGIVGTVNLVPKMTTNKLHLTKEPTNLALCNTGSVVGVWAVKMSSPTDSFPFKVSPSKFDIRPGAVKQITLSYTGPEDSISEATLIFEDVTTGHITSIEITGGTDKPKVFPIRTNFNIMSWVRPDRKEISLKNSTDKKVQIRCYTVGEGFYIDLPGGEASCVYCLTFGPNECRPLSVIFHPASNQPCTGMLHLTCENNNELSRKIKLFGSASGEFMRWFGLVTHGETALVRAITREPIALELYNKANMPAFVCANVRFNIQYKSVASTAVLSGASCIVRARARHTVTLQVEWSRVSRRAHSAHTGALATLTVLTGAELTRRRILRVLRDESTGVLDTSHLDDHLKVLTGPFEGEDPNMDASLADFSETKSSLNELIGGLHELSAQIVLMQDYADDNTILIADDTVVEHHTLCD